MSDIIRQFKFSNPTYKRGQETPDKKPTPFRLPSYSKETPTDEQPLPKVTIEGVPPVRVRSPLDNPNTTNT